MTCGEWSIGSENTAGSAVVIVRSAQSLKEKFQQLQS